MEPRAKLWLEVEGRIALSEWRVTLLELTDATGSLARAAEQMGVPYRTASYKIREIEANLGVRLLDTQSGGAEGGSSRLTPEGREMVARWREFSAGLEEWVSARFRAAFANPAPDESAGT